MWPMHTGLCHFVTGLNTCDHNIIKIQSREQTWVYRWRPLYSPTHPPLSLDATNLLSTYTFVIARISYKWDHMLSFAMSMFSLKMLLRGSVLAALVCRAYHPLCCWITLQCSRVSWTQRLQPLTCWGTCRLLTVRGCCIWSCFAHTARVWGGCKFSALWMKGPGGQLQAQVVNVLLLFFALRRLSNYFLD